MIVIRQSALKTSVAMTVLVIAFTAMGVCGLVRFKDARGRKTAIALLGVAGAMGVVSIRSISRGTVVATLRQDGLELRSGHFAGWGPIAWDDIDEAFIFNTVGLRVIGLRLKQAEKYKKRLSAVSRFSLLLDRYLAGGADAYLSAAAVKTDARDLARLIDIFRRSSAAREHFGGDDVVLEFPADVQLREILAQSSGWTGNSESGIRNSEGK